MAMSVFTRYRLGRVELFRRAFCGCLRNAFVVVCSFLLLVVTPSHAASSTERFVYDGSGRLIRTIDPAGLITEYVYDAAGNVLAVKRVGPGGGLAPTISGVSVTGFRKGVSTQVIVTGTNLSGVNLRSADVDVLISGVTNTATQYRFSVSASAAAALGVKVFSIVSVHGTVSFNLTLLPPAPTVNFTSPLIGLFPDNAPRTFTVSLSNADTFSHVVNLSVDNGAVASVSGAELTFSPGEVAKTFQIAGRAPGNTTIRAVSSTLSEAAALVFVGAYSMTGRSAYAPPVGVSVQTPSLPQSTTYAPIVAAPVGVSVQTPSLPQSTTYAPIVAAPVGIAVGAVAHRIVQTALIAGGSGSLTVAGVGLTAVTQVRVSPATGVTVGAASVSGNGTQLSVPIAVASGTQAGQRHLNLFAGSAPVEFSDMANGGFHVASQAPRIDSISPNAGRQGDEVAVVIRGVNLLSAAAVLVDPPQGVEVIAPPTVSANGTEVRVSLRIASTAAVTSRVIRVSTLGGGTSSVQDQTANIFAVRAP